MYKLEILCVLCTLVAAADMSPSSQGLPNVVAVVGRSFIYSLPKLDNPKISCKVSHCHWLNVSASCKILFVALALRMSVNNHISSYSGWRRRVLKWAWFFFFFFVFVLPILLFGRWLVCGNFAVFSSHVRPVNQNKWWRAIWSARMTYKRILPNAIFLTMWSTPMVCLYFIGNL